MEIGQGCWDGMENDLSSDAPHFWHLCEWQARQYERPHPSHGAKPLAATRCSAASLTKRGRSVEKPASQTGGSRRRRCGFQSMMSVRSDLRRRICTIRRWTGIMSACV